MDHTPSVLIVTALPREAAAVEATFDGLARTTGHSDDPFIYKKGKYDLGDGTVREVLLATLPAMGSDNAATVAAHAFRTFPSVRYALIVGIAGGCPHPEKPDEHVRLGDVVVSNEKGIIDYGHIKQTPTSKEYRSSPQAPSATLLSAFNSLVAGELLGRRPWEEYISKVLAKPNLSTRFARPGEAKDVLHAVNGSDTVALPHPADAHRRPGAPKILGGAVGTADILLKDPSLRNEIRDRFAVRAVEMEGSGMQTAAWASGHDIIVVRGICDYCDTFKNDDWQFYAALAAATVARCLIEALPSEWFA